MFTDRFPNSLIALRNLNMRVYMDIVRSHSSDQESFDAALSQIRELSEDIASDEDDLALANLTDLLASQEYRAFVQFLNETDSGIGTTAQNILETKEYEQRLRGMKEASLGDYVEELRVVTEAELVSALVNGTIVNALDEDGSPSPIRSDERYSGAFLERPTATAWVEAELLLKVLNHFVSDRSELSANSQGLRLRQVVVGGSELNLNWIDCPFPLGFEGCDFYHWISADFLKVPWLSFDSCDFTPREQVIYRTGALNAGSIVVEHELRFWDCQGLNQLFIPDARIGSFSPTNPQPSAKPAETSDENSTKFRTVLDGATFGQFFIPGDSDDEFKVLVSRSVRIETLGGLDEKKSPREVATNVIDWLKKSEDGTALPNDVWDQFEGALRRSNHAKAATEFGILAARHQTKSEGFKGWMKRLVLGPTVRYFYDNMRALWYLVGLFGIAFVTLLCVALVEPDQLVQSPLANEAVVPESWLLTMADKLVWSFLYSVDLVLSPISLGLAETTWPVSIWLSLLFAVIKGFSLLLLGLFVIGVTGLAEKRTGA